MKISSALYGRRFQSTLPRGERLAIWLLLHDGQTVSIHAPTGGATPLPIALSGGCKFQSTLPRGERQFDLLALLAVYLFQSTLPRGERLISCTTVRRHILFQSTLPRGERLIGAGIYLCADQFQSTLPRGERRFVTEAKKWRKVSILAPTGGAKPSSMRLWALACFNPRSHGGCDQPFKVWMPNASLVSIHAPTGGATAFGAGSQRRYPVSIHAPTGGATPEGGQRFYCMAVSIHAPTGGATRSSRQLFNPVGFNPRSHGGSDLRNVGIYLLRMVSIHAPTGGATSTVLAHMQTYASFNPRSHGGSDFVTLLN